MPIWLTERQQNSSHQFSASFYFLLLQYLNIPIIISLLYTKCAFAITINFSQFNCQITFSSFVNSSGKMAKWIVRILICKIYANFMHDDQILLQESYLADVLGDAKANKILLRQQTHKANICIHCAIKNQNKIKCLTKLEE